MLKEIKCDRFRKETIEFHSGLNVVLGDEKATNSIGKSSLLMVIDFVFGGSSFSEHKKDVVETLGDHAYRFCFEFKERKFFFKRETYDPKVIYICDENYEEQETISIKEYNEFLGKHYGLEGLLQSFRAIVNPYSRIWPKENLDVKKPLNVVKKQKDADAINYLLALFEKFSEIEELALEWRHKDESKKSLTAALKNDHIPKISSSKYKANAGKISLIKDEISEIKNDLALFACSINELVNREVLELKEEKDSYLEYKLQIDSKLQRIRKNLSDHAFIKSENIQKLQEFFPDANVQKIADIEKFHEGLKNILRQELEASEKKLVSELINTNLEISSFDIQIKKVLNTEVENPTLIIDRIVNLNKEMSKLTEENFFYDKQKTLTQDAKDLKDSLLAKKQKVSDAVAGSINNMVRKITTAVYSEQRKAPKFEIKNNQYNYETHKDTGTGKAYSNLILFDLAVFELTKLPFIIHDSVLFKNIENDAVSHLITFYNKNRQVFIALDEIKKYGPETEEMLIKNKVVELDNKNLLYTEDWR